MADPREVLLAANTVAVVGASNDPDKPAHGVPAYLRQIGFRVIPVNPTADTVLGERAYATLADVPEPVDVVEVFRPADEAPQIAREAVAIGARSLWLQIGIRSDEARAIAESAGLGYVENRCMRVESRLHGITKRPGS
ncbi:MAG: CoA-binding protein [Chloroflexota bacterium]|nr:CoA-binding protein [Chloroflexota bacterium]